MGARELFSSFFAETETYFAQLDLETDEFAKKLQNDHTPILQAVQKYRKTGTLEAILADKLKLVDNDAPTKKQPKGRKMATLQESSDENVDTTNVKIKQEKLSILVESTASSATDLSEEIKKEDDMPAPNWIPPKKTRATTRSTRTKGKQAEVTRDSDVIVQDPKISTINLADSEESETDASVASTRSTRTKTRAALKNETLRAEALESETRSTRTKTLRKGKKAEEAEENEPEKVEQPPRTTRTKTIRKGKKVEDNTEPKDDVVAPNTNDSKASNNNTEKSKRRRSESEEPKLDQKKSRSLSKDKKESKGETKDNPASSNIAEPAAPALDATYVAATEAKKSPHPNFNIFDKPVPNDLLTDDESIEIPKTPPKKELSKKITKEVFSPYEKTSLKKKVEAFEKLQNHSGLPIKTGSKMNNTPASKVKPSRHYTPAAKFNPTSSSTSKISRVLTTQHNVSSDTSTSKNSGSAQKDPRERYKKLLEKEQAQKKKDALLQAQAEAKRKMNEEKQLKALQQRKVLEAEKQKIVEQQKLKDARLKQREKEILEYQQMKKQLNEEKHQAHKIKLKEIRLAQEANKTKPPIYMVTEPPKLPTADCYDSDDPNYKKTKDPTWCNSDYTKIVQLSMMAAGEKIKNTLFCRHAQTPDLTKIFETIDPKKLKRSSSMHWKKPPRYTMMPDLNETRFSEDEELFEDSD